MSTIKTRITGDTAKGSPLTNAEVDQNFINLNTDKYESGDSPTFGTVNATALGSQDTPTEGLGSITRVYSPKSATMNLGGTQVGALKITLPPADGQTTGASRHMISFTVRVYEYDGDDRSFDVKCSGYVYTSGPNWLATSAVIEGPVVNSLNYNVRFGREDGMFCVWIGEETSSWGYPQVAVMDVMAGFNGPYVDLYDDKWAISLATSFSAATIDRTVSNTQLGRIAPVIYDSDNTGYYVDPASTSVLNAARFYAVSPMSFMGNGNTGTYTQSTVYANQNNTSGAEYNGLVIERGRLSNSNTAEIREFVVGQRGGGAGAFRVDKDQNTHTLNYSYAKRFVDSDDTDYYVDPAGTSYLSALQVGGVAVTTTSTAAPMVSGNVNLLQDTYVRVARISGGDLATSIKGSLTGTSGGIVMNINFEIMVNHDDDVMFRAFSSGYSGAIFRVIQNGDNQDYDLYLNYTGGSDGSVPAVLYIYPQSQEGVTINPTATAYSDTTTTFSTGTSQITFASSGGAGTTDMRMNGSYDSTNLTNGSFRIYDGTTFRGGMGTGAWTNAGTSSDMAFYASGQAVIHTDADSQPVARFSRYGGFGLERGTRAGDGAIATGYPKVVFPNVQWADASTTTGAVVIQLPGTTANYDMLNLELSIYEYNSNAGTKVFIGGHNWGSATAWHNYNVQVVGPSDKPISLGRIGDKRVIVIGTNGSSWTYGRVQVDKVVGSAYYDNNIDYLAEWDIYQSTSVSEDWSSGNLNAAGATTLKLYGSITSYAVTTRAMYDADDTSWYVEPNYTSRLRHIEGVNEHFFRGYNRGLTNDWDANIPNLGSNSTNDDSWYTGGSPSSWDKGLLSKRKFRRTPGLTLEYELYMNTSSGVAHGMIGFVPGNSTSYNYSQSGANLIYHDNSNTSVYTNGQSSGTDYNKDARDQWVAFRTVIEAQGASHWCYDGGVWYKIKHVATNTCNDFEWARVLISHYSQIFGYRNMRVYQQPHYFFSDVSTTGSVAYPRTSGQLVSEAGLQAPIFYDLNDTSYYVDPNYESKLNSLRLGSASASHYSGGQDIIETRFQSHLLDSYQNISHQAFNGNWLDGTTGPNAHFGVTFKHENNLRGGISYDHRSTERLNIWSSYGDINFYTNDSRTGNSSPYSSGMGRKFIIPYTGMNESRQGMLVRGEQLVHYFPTGGGNWQSIGTFGHASGTYCHIKTNITWNSAKMTMFRATGYFPYTNYGHGYIGCYTYPSQSSAPYGQINSNLGTYPVAHSQYYSSDGYWVLVFQWATSYNGFWLEYLSTGGSYGGQYNIQILEHSQSNSSTGVY